MHKEHTELPRVLIVSIDGLGYSNWNRSDVPMPNLKKLAKRGAEAGMSSITPSATWAIHTSIVCGTFPRKHGVLGNWVVDRETNLVGEHFGERMYPKEESVHGLTIYDAVKKIGGTTAALCWPKTWGAEGLDFVIPECYEQDRMEAGSTSSLWNELVELGLPMHMYAPWSKDHARGQMQDWLTTEIAKHIIRRHSPNLLLVHYLLPDSYQHDYGTRSNELDWSLTYIDERIGELLQELEASGGLEETYVVVMSDHGFADAVRTFYPNVMFKQQGWFDEEFPERSKAVAVSNGGSGYAYLLEQDPEEREKLREQVRSRLKSMEGIRLVVEDDAEFAEWGLPAVGEHRRFKPDFAFDMHLDWFVNFGHQGSEVTAERSKFTGMHGYFADRDEMKACFVAAGPGIEPGNRLPDIELVDVAPTIAGWFGIAMPDADGKKLQLGRKG